MLNTGSYQINGTDFLLPPTIGRWMPRKAIGMDGYGHPVYPGVREFEVRFQLGSPADYNQLQTWYEAVSNTGSVIVDLPIYGHAAYVFTSYTGCILQEPEFGEYFSENQGHFVFLITNIRT